MKKSSSHSDGFLFRVVFLVDDPESVPATKLPAVLTRFITRETRDSAAQGSVDLLPQGRRQLGIQRCEHLSRLAEITICHVRVFNFQDLSERLVVAPGGRGHLMTH